MRRPLRDYAERRDVRYANLYDDGKIGALDSDFQWIHQIRAPNCVALVRIRAKEGKNG